MKFQDMVSMPDTLPLIWNPLLQPHVLAEIQRGKGSKPAGEDQRDGLIHSQNDRISSPFSARISILDSLSQLLNYIKALQNPLALLLRKQLLKIELSARASQNSACVKTLESRITFYALRPTNHWR